MNSYSFRAAAAAIVLALPAFAYAQSAPTAPTHPTHPLTQAGRLVDVQNDS